MNKPSSHPVGNFHNAALALEKKAWAMRNILAAVHGAVHSEGCVNLPAPGIIAHLIAMTEDLAHAVSDAVEAMFSGHCGTETFMAYGDSHGKAGFIRDALKTLCAALPDDTSGMGFPANGLISHASDLAAELAIGLRYQAVASSNQDGGRHG